MKAQGSHYRAVSMTSPGPFSKAYLINRTQRDAAWHLASVRIRERWARSTALKLISQSDAEWNFVLSKEWSKVEREQRAQWESQVRRP